MTSTFDKLIVGIIEALKILTIISIFYFFLTDMELWRVIMTASSLTLFFYFHDTSYSNTKHSAPVAGRSIFLVAIRPNFPFDANLLDQLLNEFVLHKDLKCFYNRPNTLLNHILHRPYAVFQIVCQTIQFS